MTGINQRELSESPQKRRTSILVEFPDERLEAVVLQWEIARPTVLIQLKQNPREPLQFPGKRPEIPGNADLPQGQPLAIDRPLDGFVDPTNGRIFGQMAIQADILFSVNAFSLLQPGPDLVLPPEALLECRTEALRGLQIADETGIL